MNGFQMKGLSIPGGKHLPAGHNELSAKSLAILPQCRNANIHLRSTEKGNYLKSSASLLLFYPAV